MNKRKTTGQEKTSDKSDYKQFFILELLIFVLNIGLASAALQSVSPVSDPTNQGFPDWYRDNNNQALGLCLDQNGMCVLTPQFDPLTPGFSPIGTVASGQFPDESFYFIADNIILPGTRLPGANTDIRIAWRAALEQAFVNTDALGNSIIAPGQQIVFLRVDMSAKGLQPLTTYTVDHPYGNFQFVTDNAGQADFRVEDMGGCVLPNLCVFDSILPATTTNIGPFLSWDPAVAPAAPIGYIGDPGVEHRIVGGPNGNAVTVTGLNAGGFGVNSITQPLFAVAGKLTGIPSDILLTQPIPLTSGAGNPIPMTYNIMDDELPTPQIAGTYQGPITLSLFTQRNVATGSCELPSNIQLTGTTTQNAAHGVAMFTDVAIQGTGTFFIQASAPNLATGNPPTFVTKSICSGPVTLTHGAPAKIVITQPATGTVDAPITVTVQLQDALGNVVTTPPSGNSAVTLIPTGSATGDGIVTITNGIGTIQLSDTIPETISLSLQDSSATGFDVTSTSTATFATGAKSKVKIITQPSTDAVAGAALGTQPIVVIQDQFGNTVTNAADSVTITAFTDNLCTLPATGTVNGVSNLNAFNGVAQFTDLAYTKSESIFLKAAATGLTADCSNAIKVNHSTPSKFVIIPTKAGNTEFPITVTVQLQDSLGNVITTVPQGNSAVTLTATGSATGDGIVTITNGVGNIQISDFIVETINLGLVDSSATGFDVTSTSTAVFNPGSITQIAFATQPSALAAVGRNLATQPVIETRDASNNLAPSNVRVTNLALFSDAACTVPATTASIVGTSSFTTTAGVANFNNLQFTEAGTFHIGASSPGLPNVCSNAITVSPAPSKLSFITQPSVIATAGTAFAQQPTVVIQDANSIITPSVTDEITLSAFTDEACTVPATGILQGIQTKSAAAGIATFTDLMRTTSGNIFLKANSGTLNSACSIGISISAGAESSIGFTSSAPTSVTVNSGFVVSTAFQDAFGNVVDTSSGEIKLNAFSDANCTTPSTALGGNRIVNSAQGISSFSGLTFNSAGAFSLKPVRLMRGTTALSGTNEVPTTTSISNGNGTFALDTDLNTLTFDIQYSGLQGIETAAHIHGPAPAGVNAPILFTLPTTPGTKTGVWNYNENEEADIIAGNMYINIHSDAFADGEIRGQIAINPQPTLSGVCSSMISASNPPAQDSGSGGSSNSGGGSRRTSASTPVNAIKWDRLEAGSLGVLRVNDESLAVTRVEIEAGKNIFNGEINVEKLNSNPLATEPTTKVYQYLKFEKRNIEDSDTSGIKIDFSVPKSWMRTNGIAVNEISLYRFSNGRWNELPTSMASENTDKVVFHATTPGFSTFAIGEKKATPIPSAQQDLNTQDQAQQTENKQESEDGTKITGAVTSQNTPGNLRTISKVAIAVLAISTVSFAGYGLYKRNSKKKTMLRSAVKTLKL